MSHPQPLPTIRQTVLDTLDARGLAEFYRQLLGMRYRSDSEPPPPDRPDPAGQEWLVLRSPGGAVTLAFQQVSELPEATWPEGPQPQQMHLDLTVTTVANLDAQHERALELGARLLEVAPPIRKSNYASTRTQPVIPFASSWTGQRLRRRAVRTAFAASKF